jgi:hypothetical protein
MKEKDLIEKGINMNVVKKSKLVIFKNIDKESDNSKI